MARRHGSPLNGARYCGNTNKMEVHDLNNEKVNCQIDDIIAAGHAVPFNTLSEAKSAGYNNCYYCISGSMR